MTAHEWITLVGLGITALLTIAPGLMAVHAKLAVVAAQVAQLCEKVEKLSSAHEQRLPMCIDHQSRLERQEVQVGEMMERLRALEG